MSGNPETITPQRRSVPENIANIRESAGEIVQSERERLGAVVERGKERARELQSHFEGYVREKPVRSLVIAAGVGVAIGFLLARRR